MRGFLIIVCLTFSQAERLGYNYGQSRSRSTTEQRFRNRGSSVNTTPTSNNLRIGPELNNGRSGYSANSIQSANIAGPVETNYNKEFYSYSAPEEDYKDIEPIQRLAATMHKNLRVVFIKSPESNAFNNAVLQLAKQNAESKTAIYVLTKQTDVADLVSQVQNIEPSQESKPEVHFVKYRTTEDAVNAQRIIQNEYELLGGTSRVSNEHIAPILNFASNDNVNNLNIGSMNRVAVMLNSYLPSKAPH